MVVLEELQPKQIILSVKSPDEIKEHFQQTGERIRVRNKSLRPPEQSVSIEAASLFDAKGINDNLLLLTLPGSHSSWSSEEKLQFLSCFFSFDEIELVTSSLLRVYVIKRKQVTALSALLGYLLKTKEINQLEAANAPVRINSISQMKLFV